MFGKSYCNFEVYIKFSPFLKKDDFLSLNLSEVIHSKKCGCLNAINLLFRNTLWNTTVKGFETLLKSARQHFYANVPLISHNLSFVACLLVGSEILGPLLNTVTAHHMYSCHRWQKLQEQVQSELSSKPSTFSRDCIAFPKSTSNYEHFEKKITFIAPISLKWFIRKNVVTGMP